MSSKPSTSKRLPKPELMLTRHKSNLLKRQLRNKDESIKRISQITQMLKSPKSKDKSVKPQMKSPKKRVMWKQKLDKLIQEKEVTKRSLLKSQHELATVRGRQKCGVPRKGRAPHRSPSPTMQQLVRAAERHLDDEDLLEILTCASPVWWELPPDRTYIEDPIYTLSPSDMEYKAVVSKNANEGSNPGPQAAMSTIIIPPVKQTDDKFMKKRNKLENLLGNIKNKISNDCTPKSVANCKVKDDSRVKCDTETKSDTICRNTKANDAKIDAENKTTDFTTVVQENKATDSIKNENLEILNKEEIKTNESSDEEKDGDITNKEDKTIEEPIARDTRETTTSESTEEDVFSNLQNEDFLRDLENTNIPIEEEKSMDSVVEDPTAQDSQDAFLGFEKDVIDPLTSKESIADTLAKRNTDHVKEDANEDTTTSKIVKKRPLSNPELPQRDAIKIYFVDAVANTANAEFKPKISKITSIASTEKDRLSPMNVDDSTDATNDTRIVVSNQNTDTVSVTKISSIENDSPSINSKGEAETKTNKVRIKTINDINESLDRKTNNDNNKTPKNEELDSNKATKDYIVTNVEEKTFFRPVEDEFNNKPNQTQNKNISNNNKNLNKEQLMAVYKIITDDDYREKYMKTIKDRENEHPNKTKLKDEILNKDTLEFYFKKYKNGKREKQKQDLNNKLNNEDLKDTEDTKINNKIEDSKVTEDSKSVKNELCDNCNIKETSFSIVSKVKSVKYCLKCSSIFETDICNYCDRNGFHAAAQSNSLEDAMKDCKSCGVSNIVKTAV